MTDRRRECLPTTFVKGHTAGINCIAAGTSATLYPTCLLSGSDDTTARLWDIRSSQIKAVRLFRGFAKAVRPLPITAASFVGDAYHPYSELSPQGLQAATIVNVHLDNATSDPSSTQSLMMSLNPHTVLLGSGRRVYSFDLRRPDVILASANAMSERHTDEVNAIRVSPDGRSFAAVDDSGTAKISSMLSTQASNPSSSSSSSSSTSSSSQVVIPTLPALLTLSPPSDSLASGALSLAFDPLLRPLYLTSPPQSLPLTIPAHQPLSLSSLASIYSTYHSTADSSSSPSPLFIPRHRFYSTGIESGLHVWNPLASTSLPTPTISSNTNTSISTTDSLSTTSTTSVTTPISPAIATTPLAASSSSSSSSSSSPSSSLYLGGIRTIDPSYAALLMGETQPTDESASSTSSSPSATTNKGSTGNSTSTVRPPQSKPSMLDMVNPPFLQCVNTVYTPFGSMVLCGLGNGEMFIATDKDYAIGVLTKMNTSSPIPSNTTTATTNRSNQHKQMNGNSRNSGEGFGGMPSELYRLKGHHNAIVTIDIASFAIDRASSSLPLFSSNLMNRYPYLAHWLPPSSQPTTSQDSNPFYDYASYAYSRMYGYGGGDVVVTLGNDSTAIVWCGLMEEAIKTLGQDDRMRQGGNGGKLSASQKKKLRKKRAEEAKKSAGGKDDHEEGEGEGEVEGEGEGGNSVQTEVKTREGEGKQGWWERMEEEERTRRSEYVRVSATQRLTLSEGMYVPLSIHDKQTLSAERMRMRTALRGKPNTGVTDTRGWLWVGDTENDIYGIHIAR